MNIIKFPKNIEGIENASSNKEEYLDIEKFTEMLDALTALQRSDPKAYNKRNIEIRSGLLVEATNEQLFNYVKHFEKNIKSNPSFYFAVVEELRNRNLIPARKEDL